QLRRGGQPVVDVQAGGARVPFGHIDARRREVDPGYRGAEAGERLAQEAAAAADVECAQAGERPIAQRIAPELRTDAVAHVADAHWIELVQRCERARLVPPMLRQPREALEFGRLDAARHAPSRSRTASERACPFPPEYVHASG